MEIKKFFDKKAYSIFSNIEFTGVSEAFEHYQQIGIKANISPNAFFHIELAKKFKLERMELIDSFIASKENLGVKWIDRLGPLVDYNYFATKNSIDPNNVELIEKSLCSNPFKDGWINFHPILCERDYKLSKYPTIYEWLSAISNPNHSLVDLFEFTCFSPSYYRETAESLKFENELIDFLVNGDVSGGVPHVFCDYWYSNQFSHERTKESRTANDWLELLSDLPSFGSKISVFFDPFYFNHEYVHNRRNHNNHPLVEFYEQSLPIIAPHKEIIPSALINSFTDRELPECKQELISPKSVVDALENAMLAKRTSPDNVELSVCILNYNKPTHTALSAISAATNSPQNTEVLVIDNGSGQKDFEIILRLTKNCKNIKVIRSQKNLYFGEGNNVLLDRASGKYVLFLNNDAYVGKTTIFSMLEHLKQNPESHACGATFLFPDLSVQEAGGVVSDCGQQIQLHKHSDFDKAWKFAKERRVIPTQYISSACFCVKREIINDVGGYDFIYEPLYFEDTDLCKRISSANYTIELLSYEFLIHYENASTREFLGDNFMPQIAKNREIFRERWIYKPDGYRPRTIPQCFLEETDAKRKNAVIYTPYDINIGGGERYILGVAAALAKDYNAILATPGYVSKTRLAFVMDELGLELDHTMKIQTMTLDEAQALGTPHVMIAMGNEALPPIAMFGKNNIYHCQFPFPGHHEDRWESHRLDNVDAVFVNSAFTQKHMQHSLALHNRTDIPVYVTYAPVGMINPLVMPDKSRGIEIVNVGRFDAHGHSKRQDIAIDIINSVNNQSVTATLNLIGGCPEVKERKDYLQTLKKSALGKPVEFHVNLERNRLEKLLAEGDIYLHCCGFGKDSINTPELQEHFGIAVVEAMSAGLVPIVYDAGGPAEIVKASGAGYTYRTVEEAVNIIMQLSTMSKKDIQKLSKKAVSASKLYSDSSFANRISSFVHEVCPIKNEA